MLAYYICVVLTIIVSILIALTFWFQCVSNNRDRRDRKIMRPVPMFGLSTAIAFATWLPMFLSIQILRAQSISVFGAIGEALVACLALVELVFVLDWNKKAKTEGQAKGVFTLVLVPIAVFTCALTTLFSKTDWWLVVFFAVLAFSSIVFTWAARSKNPLFRKIKRTKKKTRERFRSYDEYDEYDEDDEYDEEDEEDDDDEEEDDEEEEDEDEYDEYDDDDDDDDDDEPEPRRKTTNSSRRRGSTIVPRRIQPNSNQNRRKKRRSNATRVRR